MAVIGYARVSTNGQDYNGQIGELKAAGCERIYREKVSGAQSDRVELGKLLKAIKRDDVLIVTRSAGVLQSCATPRFRGS